MRKIHNQSFTPQSFNEGGPVRKLAAAARAVIEPVESRLMMSASVATVPNQQVSTITAKYETQALPHAGQAASDPTVWVNPSDASQSTVIGTDKAGGIAVYDLSGNQIQYISNGSYYKVDTRSGFTLDGKSVSVVAADRSDTNTVELFTVDSKTRQLTNVTAGTIKLSIGGNVSGVTMYQSPDTGKTFVFVSNDSGKIEQFELSDNGDGQIAAKSVRTINVGSASQGMTADDDTGSLYVSEDGVAIWKYGAEPTDGSVRVQIDNTDGAVDSQSESLALYKSSDGSGYLIAANQTSNDYVVYDRQTGAYVTRFKISSGSVDGATSSDGIAVTSASLGNNLPEGAFVVEDDSNTGGNQNYKIVSWGDIARAQAVPLAIDTSNPAALTTPLTNTVTKTATTAVATLSAAVTTSTSAGVTSLVLYDMTTGKAITTLTDGATIDLSAYQGDDLNVKAMASSTAGSVIFTVNGSSRVENYSPYMMAGDNGVWSPTDGANSITATYYSGKKGAGTASSDYSISFTLKNTGSSSVSGSTSTSTTVTKAPAKPTSVKVSSSSSSSATVKWTAADKIADGYIVERSTDGVKFTQVATTTSTSFTDTGLDAGATYIYRVSAYNSIGTSAVSALVSVTTSTGVAPVASGSDALNGDRPSASNTGVQSTGKMTTVGSFTATSNTTYSNLIVNGMINASGLTNVTFINCIIDGQMSAQWGIRCDKGATNITIQNCEIRHMTSCAVYGEGFKAINNFVHEMGSDGFDPTGACLIQGNYVTDLGWNSSTAHSDGVQLSGADNVKIIGNFFDMPNNVANTRSNTSLMLSGDVNNVVFDSNWCVGGNYTIHAFSDTTAGNTTIKITNNIFYSGTPKFGFAQIGAGVVWSGNVTNSGLTALTNMA